MTDDPPRTLVVLCRPVQRRPNMVKKSIILAIALLLSGCAGGEKAIGPFCMVFPPSCLLADAPAQVAVAP